MIPRKRLPTPLAVLFAAFGLVWLYRGALTTPFLSDDYPFLEQARTRPLAESVLHPGPPANSFRPLSREVAFGLVSRIAGDSPRVFHAVNAALFLAAVFLVLDLLRALLPLAGALAGTLYFATLPLQRVNLTWVSCVQDLLALTLALASLALFRRGRAILACLAYLGAVLSKESAVPLPLVLGAWIALVEPPAREGERRQVPTRRLAPFAVVTLAWLIGEQVVRARAASSLHFDPAHFAAGYAHLVQSLLGLELPGGFPASLFSHLPSWVALACLGALALWLPGAAPGRPNALPAPSRPTVEGGAGTPGPPPLRAVAGLAGVWLLALGLAAGPVASIWSGYFYTLAAVGGAILVGLLCRRIDRIGWLGLTAFLLWWHAGAVATRAFAVAANPSGWSSHVTPFSLDRMASLSETLSRRLRMLEPAPPHGTRFFFATLPALAGFQMGNGAQIRALYRDRSLESYFYSQFSESTATDRPCRFLYWDGRDFQPLYAGARDRFFQVGGDLLLLERPAGAAHAFRRGLAAGEDRRDNLYWLGWAEMLRGNREGAEAAWRGFGARDDSLARVRHLQFAHEALDIRRDTLSTRRHLIQAIEAGVGQPEGHAVLGELLMAGGPEEQKYGMLELRVACWLKPTDWLARRELVAGLTRVRLDEAAARHLAILKTVHPDWRADSVVVRAARILEGRSLATRAVTQF